MTGHPYYPLLAASGIDYTVKIFSPEGLGKGLLSRQCLRDEYKIRSNNEISRRSNLRRTFISRDMLEAFALNLRAGRGGRNVEAVEGCETM
jgi:DDB1- and CUL4-associated factor 6